MGYTLAKAMKVQRADGVVELRQAGAACPEADTWANPAIWIKRGFLAPDDQETALASGYTRARLQPARPATDADAARGMNTPVPKPKESLPGYQGQGNVENADGGGDPPATGDTKVALVKMGREALESLATSRGVSEPASYANKGLLADAILATAGDQKNADGGGDPPATGDTKVALVKMGREALESLATDRGLTDPSSYADEEALADAILATAGE